jgi:cytochrome P450 family 135
MSLAYGRAGGQVRNVPHALPPGPPLPLAAQTLAFWGSIDRFLRGCERRYGSTFTMRVFPWGETVVVADPEAIETVLTGSPQLWRAGESYDLLSPLIGERSIVVLDGPEHLHVRRQLLPPFHGETVLGYEQLIEHITAAEISRWPIGKPFALTERLRSITLEVLLRAVIGTEESQRLDELRVTLARAVLLRPLLLLMWVWQPLGKVGPWRAFNNCLKHARDLLLDEIQLRRADPDVADRTDVLSRLIVAGELDDSLLLDQLATIMLAGHDTSTTALSWAMERLVRHPEVLARAQHDERYLDAVVKETLRMRPVLPAVTRRTAAPVQIAGMTLPAGVTVMPAIRLVQLSPRHYSDPDVFRPERFLEGEGQGYSWIAYGGGTHRCIGATFANFQMRIVLRTILARAELRADRAAEESVSNQHITLVPGRGSRVIMTARKQARALAA